VKSADNCSEAVGLSRLGVGERLARGGGCDGIGQRRPPWVFRSDGRRRDAEAALDDFIRPLFRTKRARSQDKGEDAAVSSFTTLLLSLSPPKREISAWVGGGGGEPDEAERSVCAGPVFSARAQGYQRSVGLTRGRLLGREKERERERERGMGSVAGNRDEDQGRATAGATPRVQNNRRRAEK